MSSVNFLLPKPKNATAVTDIGFTLFQYEYKKNQINKRGALDTTLLRDEERSTSSVASVLHIYVLSYTVQSIVDLFRTLLVIGGQAYAGGHVIAVTGGHETNILYRFNYFVFFSESRMILYGRTATDQTH